MREQRRLIIRLGLSSILILLLTILMLIIFGEPSSSAYNARTVSQLQQYMTALELVRLENGTYPLTTGPVCLGDYADDLCWDNEGRGVKEDPSFNESMDNFVPLLSAGKLVMDKDDSTQDREGYTYESKQNGHGYEIQFALQGKNMRCGFGGDLSVTVEESGRGEITYCSIMR
jgi:hypothetical protein